jgi:release factor glutamine methyltransferase
VTKTGRPSIPSRPPLFTGRGPSGVAISANADREREAETIGTIRRRIARELTEAFKTRGYDGTPALDARLLVAQATGLTPGAVPLSDDVPVGAEAVARALSYAARRAAGEPVARIVGHKEFHGLDFMLSQDTLVPRPETETLVDAALALVAQDARARIVDAGSGSGAILLSVLAERPNAIGIGIDIAPGAAATAQANAARLGLAGRALFVVGDWLAPVGPVDVILANPPYIQAETISRLDPEVRENDPVRALDGGEDGLQAIRAIVAACGGALAENGILLMEVGAGQSPQVATIAEKHGMAISFKQDLAGIDRVAIVGRR